MQPRHLVVVLAFALSACVRHHPPATVAHGGPRVSEASVRAHLEFLASDALNGRGSGTRDEQLAAEYVGAMFRALGLEPGGEGGSYVQTIGLERRSLRGEPALTLATEAGKGAASHWTSGKEFILLRVPQSPIAGALRHVNAMSDAVERGSVAFVNKDDMQLLGRALEQRASAVLMRAAMPAERWSAMASRPPGVQAVITGVPEPAQRGAAIVFVNQEAADRLQAAADGTEVRIDVPMNAPQTAHTYNAVGILRGRDPVLKEQAVLITAHLDHLGRKESASGADEIFNGADDDASGTVAVMEIAQALAARARPKRTVIFACFGSEEDGGYGAAYLREKPPVPLDSIVANVEFEMIGRPDPKVPPHMLWLTGYERSDLGAALASHGARLVADPHPEENFFQRSDNYTLARRGVVAHTVSSFGLHREYHTAKDETRLVDYAHMREAIESMIEPLRWLTNSSFRPKWSPSGRPGQ